MAKNESKQVAPDPIDGASDGSIGGPPPAKAAPITGRYPYTVAAGKSLTCAGSRRVLGEGQEITLKDINEDASQAQTAMNELVDRGYVVKRS